MLFPQNAISISETELQRSGGSSFLGMFGRGALPEKLNTRLRAALELASALKVGRVIMQL